MFAAGLLAGGADVAARKLARSPRRRAQASLRRDARIAEPVMPGSASRQSRARPGQRWPGSLPVAASQAGDTAPGRGQQPGLHIGVLGPLTVNGQAGALVPAQSQLIVALALNRGGLSNGQLRGLLGADRGTPEARGLAPAAHRQDPARAWPGRRRPGVDRAPGSRPVRPAPDAWVDWREFETLAGQRHRDRRRRELLARRSAWFGGSRSQDASTGGSTRNWSSRSRRGSSAPLSRWRAQPGQPRPGRGGQGGEDRARRRLVCRAALADPDARRARRRQPGWGPRGLGPLPGRVSEIAADGQPDPATPAVYSALSRAEPAARPSQASAQHAPSARFPG